MENADREELLVEYQMNVELWKHDDSLRQQRTGNFLGVTVALVSALGVFVGLKPQTVYLAVTSALFAIFGLLACYVWQAVQARNAEYVRFRRHQLRYLESKLPTLTTFSNTFAAFYQGKTVRFSEGLEPFTIKSSARNPSTISESTLPLLIAVFWLIVLVCSSILGAMLLMRHGS